MILFKLVFIDIELNIEVILTRITNINLWRLVLTISLFQVIDIGAEENTGPLFITVEEYFEDLFFFGFFGFLIHN